MRPTHCFFFTHEFDVNVVVRRVAGDHRVGRYEKHDAENATRSLPPLVAVRTCTVHDDDKRTQYVLHSKERNPRVHTFRITNRYNNLSCISARRDSEVLKNESNCAVSAHLVLV